MTFTARIHLRGRLVEGDWERLLLEPAFAALDDLSPVFAETIEAAGEIHAGEVEGEYWLPPDSPGRIPWVPRHPFGTYIPRSPAFGAAYVSALRGGAGSIRRIGRREAAYGISGSRFPWAHLHRGGSGAVTTSVLGKGLLISSVAQQRPWKRVKPPIPGVRGYAIWQTLRGRYGVKLRAETLARGLFVPFRPHLTANLPVANALSQAAKRHVIRGLKGEAPTRAA